MSTHGVGVIKVHPSTVMNMDICYTFKPVVNLFSPGNLGIQVSGSPFWQSELHKHCWFTSGKPTLKSMTSNFNIQRLDWLKVKKNSSDIHDDILPIHNCHSWYPQCNSGFVIKNIYNSHCRYLQLNYEKVQFHFSDVLNSCLPGHIALQNMTIWNLV